MMPEDRPTAMECERDEAERDCPWCYARGAAPCVASCPTRRPEGARWSEAWPTGVAG